MSQMRLSAFIGRVPDLSVVGDLGVAGDQGIAVDPGGGGDLRDKGRKM